MKMAAEELARADEERLQAWHLLEEVVFLFTGYSDGLPIVLQFWITSLSLGMAMASPICMCMCTGYGNGLPNVDVLHD